MLHDDWEINGDGTGDPERLMFDPARRLLDICDLYGARYTFFAEVGQQLTMLNSAVSRHQQTAAEWERILVDAVRRGHDVQLHLHPQWSDAHYVNGRWRLDYKKWSLASLNEEEILTWFRRGKEYLESLLAHHAAGYRVVAFRAGGWMNQPSKAILAAMHLAGLLADVTVVPGRRVDLGPFGAIDFSGAPSAIIPWYASPDDVVVAAPSGPVVCIPTYAERFRAPLPIHLLLDDPFAALHYSVVARRRYSQDVPWEFNPRKAPPAYNARTGARDGGRSGGLFPVRSTYASFGYIHERTLRRMVRRAMDQADQLGVSRFPFIMLTHSKSFLAYSNFGRLLDGLGHDPRVRFSTTRKVVVELAERGIDDYLARDFELSGDVDGRRKSE